MDALRSKLKWLMGIRVAVVTLTLGVLIYFQIGKSTESIPAYYSLIVATYLLTILYGVMIKRTERLVLFAYIQIGVDILFETVLVALTGGVESPFSLLYILSITAASALLSQKGGLAAASVAGILYGAIVDIQYYRSTYGMFPFLSLLRATELPVPEIFYNLSINILGFLMVGYLSGTLAERLERKARDLTELQEIHRFILESIDSGVFTTDSEGRLTSFNKKAELVMGYAKADVRGRFWWDVFAWPDDVRDRFPAATLPGGIEEISVRKDGRRMLLGMNLSTLYDEHGASIGMVGVFQDISLQKKRDEETRRRQWLARIGELSAGLAHEIRNPLAALSGSMQVLRKALRPSDDHRLLLDLAVRETERLNGIVSDFLHYARPRPLNLKDCNINELAQDTVRMLEQTPEYGGRITFVTRLAQEGAWGLLDPDQMRQVCLNIGLNACQAMPSGGTLTVSTRRVAEGEGRGDHEAIELVFEDTGAGIPREHREKMFDPFFTTKDTGTGLGLSVVHRIMEDHNGRVQVDSGPGAGTRVRLTLPAVGAPVL